MAKNRVFGLFLVPQGVCSKLRKHFYPIFLLIWVSLMIIIHKMHVLALSGSLFKLKVPILLFFVALVSKCPVMVGHSKILVKISFHHSNMIIFNPKSPILTHWWPFNQFLPGSGQNSLLCKGGT